MRPLWWLFGLLLAAGAGNAAPELHGETSHPATSLYVSGESVTLTFTVTGLTAADAGLKLQLTLVDEHDTPLARPELPVVAGADGRWQATVEAPHERLGFYRVRAKLSDGTTLPKLASRAAGYLTYAVVPPPEQRRLYPAEETFFGMQGGFNPKLDIVSPLGVRWLLGGYNWNKLEPDHAGQFTGTVAHDAANEWSVGGKAWQTYPLPTVFMAPKWAVKPETAKYCTGTLTPAGETAWVDYCKAVGRSNAAAHPELAQRLYQITWEPVYPWGFGGTDEDLVRIYQLAYPALHEADPQAVVLGPTGGGINPGDLEWLERLLAKGLTRAIDGVSIHPYHSMPPEPNGLVEHVRALKEAVRQAAGRDLPLYGTEQGWATGEDPAKELDQARSLLRANLIMFGEGFRCNFAFYAVDYWNEPGYGYFYNLNPKIPWGSDKVAPKPIVPGYAAQSLLLEGHHSTGAIEWLGETALGYGFERGDDVVLALWDFGEQSREVALPVGVEQVTVRDWMGNARAVATAGGSLTLTLGPEPQYVSGVSPKVWGSHAARPLKVATGRLMAAPGTKVTVEATLAAPADAALDGTVRLEADRRLGIDLAPQPVRLAAGATQALRLTLALPADLDPGTYPIKLTLHGAAGALGADGLMLRVVPPLSVTSVTPRGGPGQWQIGVNLVETQGAAQIGHVSVRLAGLPESRAGGPYRLVPHVHQMVVLPLPDLAPEPTRVYQAVVEIQTDQGYRFTREFPVNFLAAPKLVRPPGLDASLSGWPAGAPIVLSGRAAVVRAPELYHGAADLAGRLRFAWDDHALYLAAEVTEDVFFQPHTGFDTWKGDCLQVGLDLDPGKAAAESGNQFADLGTRHRAIELDLALTPNGPEAFRTLTYAPDKLPVRLLTPAELPLAVRRVTGGLVYEAAIPWSVLGAAAAPADGVGLAVAINHMRDDKQLDPMALGLFGGIYPAKDAGKFGRLVLEGGR